MQRTKSQKDGGESRQVEHGAPRGGRQDNIDGERGHNANADDQLVDAAKSAADAGWCNLRVQPYPYDGVRQ